MIFEDIIIGLTATNLPIDSVFSAISKYWTLVTFTKDALLPLFLKDDWANNGREKKKD